MVEHFGQGRQPFRYPSSFSLSSSGLLRHGSPVITLDQSVSHRLEETNDLQAVH